MACRAVWRTRRKDLLCADGAVLLTDRDETRAEAKRQAELDKLPVPGQGVLFASDEIASARALPASPGGG